MWSVRGFRPTGASLSLGGGFSYPSSLENVTFSWFCGCHLQQHFSRASRIEILGPRATIYFDDFFFVPFDGCGLASFDALHSYSSLTAAYIIALQFHYCQRWGLARVRSPIVFLEKRMIWEQGSDFYLRYKDFIIWIERAWNRLSGRIEVAVRCSIKGGAYFWECSLLFYRNCL